MSSPDPSPRHAFPAHAIAESLVAARLAAGSLAGFPGPLPDDLAAGYACQDHAIARWPDRVVGWKVGYIAADRRDASGDERVTGPIFAGRLWHDRPGHSTPFPVFAGGFAAVEAEYVFRIARDADPDQHHFSPAQAGELVEALYIGIETAGSPMAAINVLGPSVVVADFGNNAGLILGREIPDWTQQPDDALRCETLIDGVVVGRGGAASISGGLLGALAFALGRCARRGLPLKAGMLVTTGAATGIHDIVAGQRSELRFGPWGSLHCHAVTAVPSASGFAGASQ